MSPIIFGTFGRDVYVHLFPFVACGGQAGSIVERASSCDGREEYFHVGIDLLIQLILIGEVGLLIGQISREGCQLYEGVIAHKVNGVRAVLVLGQLYMVGNWVVRNYQLVSHLLCFCHEGGNR